MGDDSGRGAEWPGGQRRVWMTEEEAERLRKPPFWGRTHEERWTNYGMVLGVIVCFGLPAFFILRGLLT